MKNRMHAQTSIAQSALAVLCASAILALPILVAAQPSPAATAAYDVYIRSVESRLARQHHSAIDYLANLTPDSPRDLQIHRGQILLEDLTPASSALPGSLIHHWRATAFVPGATAADFDHLLRDFPAYPRIFAPQVQHAAVLSRSAGSTLIIMRMLQRHVLTVVLDGTFRVTFGRLDALHEFSTSASTGITEIESAGTLAEHSLAPAETHGFLWRMNTYWSYEQRDGGLYLQIETISLSRSIPFGLAWAVRPYTETIPRDSLTFTLNAARHTLEHSHFGASPTALKPLVERTNTCPPHQ
ncbi:MAG TPA: hypothetical protein VND90_05955 [Terracidiphilus sp.]|nr:hypothetical protein [Terracidiphilus sp.]